jgi:hypothetical protein
MSTLSVRLPESLHEAAREMARQDGTSINQLLVVALAEKLAAIKAFDYFEQRAARGSMERFCELMAKVPDAEPEEYDRL